jgi:hypothetical protein
MVAASASVATPVEQHVHSIEQRLLVFVLLDSTPCTDLTSLQIVARMPLDTVVLIQLQPDAASPSKASHVVNTLFHVSITISAGSFIRLHVLHSALGFTTGRRL